MLFGAAIASLAPNIYLGVFLALASHYFLDLFPHIEYLESTKASVKKIKSGNKKEYLADGIKVLLDFSLGLALIFSISGATTVHAIAWTTYLFALVAILPDGLTVITHLFPNALLKKHHQIHSGPIHYLTKQKNFPLFWKVFSQSLAAAISIAILSV